ncbi:MAG: hypothetical protein JWM14_1506 [Chitinophagaceae bacterium]|nr:hypothetical protein [Chitinophagaceae bacterium]
MLDFSTSDEDLICISAMAHICEKVGGTCDKYTLLKIIYFAERLHLSKYGCSITEDKMSALKHGPVPSRCFDIVKSNSDNFVVSETEVSIIGNVDYDFLSESNLECLNISIEQNNGLSFNTLKTKSHDAAYNKTVTERGLNSTMDAIEIAKALKTHDGILKYIEEEMKNKRMIF